MAKIISKKPLTPSQRFRITVTSAELHTGGPVKKLTAYNHRSKGRNCYGRITSRRRGGGHKRLYRQIDFRRNEFNVAGKVVRLEYDPNRSSHIALVEYPGQVQTYIVAPRDLKIGDIIKSSTDKIELLVGNNMPLKHIAPSTFVHCVELLPNGGARIARSAGNLVQVMAVEGEKVTLKLPSGEIRYVHSDCRATVGQVGNVEHEKESIGKAGRNRWKGKRPRVRGISMNPVDHPNGGGGGKAKGGGGWLQPVSPWGQLAKGFPTRTKSKASNNQILVRRNGRKVKKV
jgi:large subunit ribosomal protein L2